MGRTEKKLEIEWERIDDGKGNYLKLMQQEGDYSFADKIFSYEEITGFLPMEIRRIHGEKEAYYNVTGKISLARYLAEEDFNRADLGELLLQILALQDVLEEYLLEGNDLLIHEEFLYWDRVTKKVEGIYYAGSCGGSIQAYSYLLEAVMEHMDQKNRELVFFVYGLHKQTMDPDCVRQNIRNFIKEETGLQNSITEMHDPNEQDRKLTADGDPVTQRDSWNSQRDLQNSHREPWNRQRGSKNRYGEPQNRHRDLQNKHRDSQNKKKAGEGKYAALIVAGGIVCFLFLWRTGAFTDPVGGGIQMVRFAAALAFFIIVCGYAAWRLYPQKIRKKDGGGGIQMHGEKEAELQVCLIPEKSGEKLIPVDHSPFYIGKNAGKADAVLEEGGVSDLHLRIFQENGSVYAVDHESAQGTLHNGTRMVPWQNKELQDGDYLTIGTHEFVVEVTSSGYVI